RIFAQTGERLGVDGGVEGEREGADLVMALRREAAEDDEWAREGDGLPGCFVARLPLRCFGNSATRQLSNPIHQRLIELNVDMNNRAAPIDAEKVLLLDRLRRAGAAI